MKKIMWRCSGAISGFSSCELESRYDLEEALSHFKLVNYVIIVYTEKGIVDLEVHGIDASLKADVIKDTIEVIGRMTETKKEVKTYKRWRKKF